MVQKIITIISRIVIIINKFTTKILFKINKAKYGTFFTAGIPIVDVRSSGELKIGNGAKFINNATYSTLGKSNKCKLLVYDNAKLIIGENVGMSNTTIVATKSIILGNNILVGGGTSIVDSDFHSLDYHHWNTINDEMYMISKPVIIEDNVFIGMNSIILKGVKIGKNSIIAAGSVVTTNINENEIWGGNPAKFIKYREY